jgi:ADP-ribose pyrophosphatase
MKPRRIRRTRIFSGKVFRVERDLVRLSNGRIVPMEIVRHRGSVVLLPQPSAARIILVRQFRYVVGRWIWELPAGSIERGETPARAARRECEEETGWRPGRVRWLGAYYPSPGFCDEVMLFYVCSALTRPARAAEGDVDEELEPRVFTLREARRLVEQGRILDMKTLAGLVLLSRRPEGRRLHLYASPNRGRGSS